MEIHGVKLFFRRERAYPEPEPYDRASCGKAPAKAQETRNRDAQSLPVRKLKPSNSRQRRSARRLAEFIRAQGACGSVAAADSGAMSSPNASPRECLARARGGAQGSETTPGETRGEPAAAKRIGAGDHAHILYSAWKQKVLAGSPAESSEMEATKTSPKRARGSSRERQAPESGGSRSSCSLRSTDEHTDSEMNMSDISDSAKPVRRLEPWPPKGGKGRGGSKAKGKKGGKGRGRGRR